MIQKRVEQDGAQRETMQTIAKDAMTKLPEQFNSNRHFLARSRIDDVERHSFAALKVAWDQMTTLQQCRVKVVVDANANQFPEYYALSKQVNALVSTTRQSMGLVNYLLQSVSTLLQITML